jgi:ABC-type transport system involved in cytochrome c biogenesis permease component
MTALPVIRRELRVECRNRSTYRARVVAGGLVTCSFALTALVKNPAVVPGLALFDDANRFVSALIWILAPLLTADCLSREKREGTLGLLLLTPLTPTGIVLGKSFVHGLRSSSFLVAATPVLAIALLLGGVSKQAVLHTVLYQLGALAIALAAGLLASAWTREWIQSVIVAAVLTALFGSTYYQLAFGVMRGNSWSRAILLFTVGLLILTLAITAAAHHIRDTWRNPSSSRFTLWWLRTFCSAKFFKNFFHQFMRRSLDRNPIGWLHDCSTSVRVARWIWLGAALVASTAMIGTSVRGLNSFVWFQFAISLAMAFSGSASFRRERQNGIIELIAVSPLTTDEIVRGRLQSVTKQFRPAIIAMTISLIALLNLQAAAGLQVLGHILFMWSSLVTLPQLGLSLSFHLPRFSAAWISTCVLGLVIPYVAVAVVSQGRPLANLAVVALLQFIIGQAVINRLRRNFSRFALAYQLASHRNPRMFSPAIETAQVQCQKS